MREETSSSREPAPAGRRPPAPLLLPAVGFAAGITFDDAAGAGIGPYLAGSLIGAGLVIWPFTRREAGRVAVSLLAFCAGGLSHDRCVRRLPATHVLRYVPEQPVLARVAGTVVTPPRMSRAPSFAFSPWLPGGGRTRFFLTVERIQTTGGWMPARGIVKISVKAPVLALTVGEPVELFGWCYRSLPSDNPGQYDWARRDRRRGVWVGMSCGRRGCVRRLDPARGTRLALWEQIRQRARALLLDDMPAEGDGAATLLDTMVLGRRSAVAPEINDAFIRIGCAHYLAVSGMHVGMLGLIVWAVGRTLGASARTCAALVVGATVLYAVIAEPRPPILRATVMTAAVCIGIIGGRSANFLNGLSLAALVIMVIHPGQLFDPGFQLSFIAVLAIVHLSPRFMASFRRLGPGVLRGPEDDGADLFVRPPAPSSARLAWRWTALRFWWMPLAASMAAWLGCMPLVLTHFGRVSPWGWLASVVLLPFVFAVMVLSFTKLVGVLVWPTLAPVLNAPVQWGTSATLWLVALLDRLPTPDAALGPPPLWLTVSWYATLWMWAGGRDRTSARWGLRGLACVTALGAAWWLLPPRGDGRLTMTVLSVGRGTTVVLELPDARTVLYDAGASGSYDPGASTIVPFLRHRGIRRVGAILISHPNLDHFSGLPTTLESVRAGPVYTTPYFDPLSVGGKPGRALLDDLRERGHPVRTVSAGVPPSGLADVGGVVFEVLWPPPDLGEDIASNETSLVVRVSYAGRSILLTGDIEALAQARLLAGGDIRADVLLMPHHGSTRHNTFDFVAAVNPSVVISSTFVRAENRDETFDRLIGNRPHYSTADCGAVTVTLSGEGLTVHTHRPGARQ